MHNWILSCIEWSDDNEQQFDLYSMSGGFVLSGGCNGCDIVCGGFLYSQHRSECMYRMPERHDQHRCVCNDPKGVWHDML